MTLINKSWLKSEVLRLWLSGDSQEAIADQLNISVGTVNSLVNEIIKSDDTTDYAPNRYCSQEKWCQY